MAKVVSNDVKMEPQKIFELLRDKIIWLGLEPEKMLNIGELANEFGVSRTPVKEALIMLEADGWILRNGSNFMVTPLSLDRIKNVTELRLVIEAQATLWAMERITPEEITALLRLKEKILKLDENASMHEMLLIDSKFHQIIFKATKNIQLVQVLDRLLGHSLRFWLFFPRKIDRQKFFAEILDTIESIVKKDTDKLRKAAETHVRNTVDELMGFLLNEGSQLL
jgi:DNA-binding GntR family transcriptional regulator